MNRVALACVITLACGSAAAAQTPVRIVPRTQAPAAAAPAVNPAIAISPQDLANLKKYDPAKDVGALKIAVAALQEQVAALQAENASLKAKVGEVHGTAGDQVVVNLNQAKTLAAQASQIAELKAQLEAANALYKDHYHTVLDGILNYTNREVVSESHATGDDYITIGSVTGGKMVDRKSSGPRAGPPD
jgi:regulator of replication initiation timing